MTLGLTFGNRHIRDMLHPQPDEIDVAEILPRLECIHRFSGNPRALTVAQHVRLVLAIAERERAEPEVIEYLRHHDDHEAIIGDIPGPLKNLVGHYVEVIARVESALDIAIWKANGSSYYLPWIDEDRGRGTRRYHAAHALDKMAETVEWRFVLCQPPRPWNREMPDWLVAEASSLIADSLLPNRHLNARVV